MRTRTTAMVIALSALVVLAAFAGDAVLGRDVARDGSIVTLSGSLLYEMDDWMLSTDDGRYELHMGPYGHDESLPLVAGADAWVRGFAIPGHVAPIQIETAGRRLSFWHQGRYPLWAGSGERRHAVEEGPADRDGIDGRRMMFLDQRSEAEAEPRGWAWEDDFEPAYRHQDARPGRGR